MFNSNSSNNANNSTPKRTREEKDEFEDMESEAGTDVAPRAELKDMLNAFNNEICGQVTTQIRDVQQKLGASVNHIMSTYDASIQTRFATMENNLNNLKKEQDNQSVINKSVEKAIQEFRQFAAIAESAMPEVHPPPAWEGATDPTIFRVGTPEILPLESVKAALSSWLELEANIKNTQYEISVIKGDATCGNQFLIQATGERTAAARRINMAQGCLYNKTTKKWKEF